MAFKLSEILNPQSDPASPAPEAHEGIAQVTSSHDAASALNALAPSGAPSHTSTYAHSGAPTAPIRPFHSPTNSYSGDRPGSSYGAHGSPIEPSPPVERAQPLSSGLERYHHGSKSPEQQRRESISHPPDRTATLPPLKLFSHFDDSITEESDRPNTSYGQDTSRMVSNGNSNDINTVAHNRESDYKRNSPVTSQIRKPVPPPLVTDASPTPHTDGASFTPHIKDEPASTPRTSPPHKSPIADVDVETARAIAEAANEYGTRRSRPNAPAEPATPATTATIATPGMPAMPAMPEREAAVPTKKRPAPAKAGTKKGVARKPPPKKRKIEAENGSTSPTSRPSSKVPGAMRGGAATKGSKSNTPQVGSSPAQEGSSPVAEEYEDGDEDASDNEVYCICRKGDDHSWMIACDGCDDWFHGRCVSMKEEQGLLIEKYICPNCTKDGRGVTTWKPQCRRPDCNRPADIKPGKGKKSKYCSDECGRLFLAEKMGLGASAAKKAKKKTNKADHTGNEMDIDDDDDLGSRGGALRAGELKAMVDSVKGIEEFRRLGEGVLSPPETASPTKSAFDNSGAVDGEGETKRISEVPAPQPPSFTLTPSEQMRIQAISDEKDRLTLRRALLRDRETFTRMAMEQGNKYAEKEGLKPKDVCGYDSRLAWSEPQFAKWRDSKQGKEALRIASLDTTPQLDGQTNGDIPEDGPADKPADATMNETPAEAHVEEEVEKGNFCARKRCEQHKQWAKISLMEVKAELSDLHADRAKLEEEEKEIRQRANIRWRQETSSSKAKGVDARDLEGWVEVVEG